MSEQINKNRIAKNTLLLYLRMGLVMVVSLYTSRVLLQALGIIDYGIYNVVGGVVVMFSVFNNILTVAIRRFLSVELSKNDDSNVEVIFKSSVRAVQMLALVLVVVLETVGLWFVNYKLNIPLDRLSAANWVFQFSILTFVLNLMALPYNSAIVAFERMAVYAYYGIIEVILKLLVTCAILCDTTVDRLILYALLYCLTSNIIRYLNVRYCKRNIIRFTSDVKATKRDMLAIFSFSAWAVAGSIVGMLATQGINIMINLFWGVAINAAMGISQQVTGAVSQFGGNFQTAFNPQLTMSYAAEKMSQRTQEFTISITKLTVLLVLMLVIPITTQIDNILALWLTEVPQYAAPICVISIIFIAIDLISAPLYILVYADGNVKLYSIVLSIIQIAYIIAFYIACQLGANPVQAMSMYVISGILLHIARMLMLKRISRFNVSDYLKRTHLTLVGPLVLSFFAVIAIDRYIKLEGFTILVVKTTLLETTLLISIFFFYFNKYERQKIVQMVRAKINK